MRPTEIIDARKETINRIKRHLQGTMLKKLEPTSLWSYVTSIPPAKTLKRVEKEINDFAFHKMDGLIELCNQVLPFFTYEDMASIGSSKPTENANKFRAIFNYLIANGFPGPKDFPNSAFNFWSGKIGKERAYSSADAISDSNIPAIAAMYDICRSIRLLQGKHDEFIDLLISAISRLYSSYATGIVNVYISSDKPSEMPGLVAKNNFWNSELPTLRYLLQRKLISDIQIHTYDHLQKKWNASFSINSAKMLELPIRYRSIHPLDNPLHANRFQTFFMSESNNHEWSTSAPRPEISYSALLKICGIWRSKVHPEKLETGLTLAPEIPYAF